MDWTFSRIGARFYATWQRKTSAKHDINFVSSISRSQTSGLYSRLFLVVCSLRKRKKVHTVQYKASSYVCWFGRKIAITNIRQQFYFNFNLFTKTGLSCKNHFRVWQTSKRPRKCYSSYLYEVISPHNSSLGLVMVLTLSTAFSMDLTTENQIWTEKISFLTHSF